MGVNFDRWTLLKLLELALAIACLACKRWTDDEASRLFLYLQKISREWSLLNNITWDRIGAAVADATYGGYIIITGALFLGRLFGELPTEKRITEFVLLGVGALLFIILGSLEFASLDSVPQDLVDNAAVLGTLTLVTAALFLLDMGGPRARKSTQQSQTPPRTLKPPVETRSVTQQVYDIEKELERSEKAHHLSEEQPTTKMTHPKNGVVVHGLRTESNGRYRDSVYKKIKDDKAKHFGIYGKDVHDGGGDGGSAGEEEEELPPKMAEHSPVWSQYGKYDIISPSSYLYPKGANTESGEKPPSGPGDPGYVQYTAQHWGEPGQKTPRHSPTQV